MYTVCRRPCTLSSQHFATYYSDLISVRGSGDGGGLKVEGPGKSCGTINTVLIYTHIYIYSYSLIYWLILITYSNNFSNMYSARNYQRHPTAWEISRQPWDKWKKPETLGWTFRFISIQMVPFKIFTMAMTYGMSFALRNAAWFHHSKHRQCHVPRGHPIQWTLHRSTQPQAATSSYNQLHLASFRCLKKSSWTPLESLWPAFRAPCVLGVSLGDSWSLTWSILLRCPCSTIS